MANDVLEFFREKEPSFKDVSDRELTEFIFEEYPEMRDEKEFADSYRKMFQPTPVEEQIDSGEIGKPVVIGKKPKRAFFDASKDYVKQSGKFLKLYDGSPDDVGKRQQALRMALESFNVIEGESEQNKARRMLGLQKTFEREKQKALAEGESGWAYFVERLPFVGAQMKATEFAMVADAAYRIDSNDYQDGPFQLQHRIEDAELIGQYLADLEREEGKGWLRKTTDLATNIPAFGVEFMTTAGGYFTGKKAVETGVKKLTSKIVKDKIENKLVNSVAKRGLQLTGFLGGAATQAVVMPQMVSENFFETLASDKIKISKDERDRLSAFIAEDDPAFGRALYEAYAKTFVETASERTGLVLGKVFNKAAGTVADKFTPGLKAAISRRWMKLNDISRAGDLMDEVAKRAGWSGVIGEVLEERVAEVGRAALTRETYPDRTLGEWLEQLSIEGAAFSVPGATGSVIDKVGKYVDSREYDKVMQTYSEEAGNVAALLGTMPPQEEWGALNVPGDNVADPILIPNPFAEIEEPEEAIAPPIQEENVIEEEEEAPDELEQEEEAQDEFEEEEEAPDEIEEEDAPDELSEEEYDQPAKRGEFDYKAIYEQNFQNYISREIPNSQEVDNIIEDNPDIVRDLLDKAEESFNVEGLAAPREEAQSYLLLHLENLIAQKDWDLEIDDPVSGMSLTQIDLMNQLEEVGLPEQGFEFHKRRGYTLREWLNIQLQRDVGLDLSDAGVKFDALAAFREDIIESLEGAIEDQKAQRAKSKDEVEAPDELEDEGEVAEVPAYNPPRVFERQFGSTVNAQDRIDDLKGLKESWKNKEISGEDYKAQLLEVINAPTKAELKERNAEGFTPIQIGVKKEAQKQVNALLNKKLTKTVKPKEEEEAPAGLNLVYEEKLDGSGKKKIQVAKIPGQLIGEYRTQLVGIKKTEKRTGTTYRVVSSDTKALNWNAVPSAPGEHSSEEEALQVLEDFILRYHWDVNPAKFGTQKIKDSLIEYAKSFYDESITSEAFFDLKLKELKKLQDRAPYGLPRGNKDQYQANLIDVQNWARKAHGLGPLPEEDESVTSEEIDEAPEESDDAFEDEVVDEKPPVEAPSTIGRDDLKAQKAWLEVYVDEAINNVPDPDTLNERQSNAIDKFKMVYLINKVGGRQQIHQDIREAMDKLDQYGMLITFDVPGDGIYRILNTKEALEDFKKRIKKFPTATARARKLSKGSTKPKSISSLGKFNQPIVKAVKALQGITTVDQSTSKGFVHTINAGELVASNGAILVLIKNTNVPAKSSYDPKTGKKYKAYKLDNEKVWMKHFQNPAAKFAGFDTAEMLGILNKIAALQAKTETETMEAYSPTIKFYANEKGWSVESEIFSQVKVVEKYDGDIRSRFASKSKFENQSNYFRQGTEGDYVVSLGLGQFKLLVEAARKSGEQHLSLHLPEKSETDVVNGNPIVIKGKNLQGVIMPVTGDNLPTVKRSAVTDIGSAPLASVEKATLPRAIEAPHYKTGQPVSFTEIRKFLSHSLDIPIRLGVNRMRAHGVFFPRREVIRMKLIDNIPTIAHEVGHYLHFIMFPRMNWMGQLVDPTSRIEGDAFDFAREFDGELKELGKATSRPNYDENQVRKEGVAEFVREFLTDRPNAIKRAPKFHQYFVDTLENNFPEINKILEQATSMIETLVNQSGYDSILSMMKIDGHQMPGEKGNARQTLRKLYTRWVNELAPLERTIKQLQDYGLKAPNDQLADQLAINYMGGWLGKVEHTLKQRQIDHEGNDMGPSLEDVLSGVENLTEFQVYLVALRAVEKTGQGKESGLTASHRDEDTNDLIEKFKNFIEENKDKYESHRQKLDKFLTNELIILANAGFITHGEFKRIKDNNEFYVPFHRVHDRVGSIGGGAGKGFIDLSKGGLKGYHGGGGQIVPPLESVVKNLYVQRDLVERNRVGQAFINNINSTFGGGKVADQIVSRIEPTEVKTDEVALQMKKLGLIKMTATEETKDLPREEREYIYTNAETGEVMNPDHFAFTIWRATKTEDAKSGKFSVWFDGKRQYYQMDDPELYRALQLQDSTAAEITSRWPGFATASKFTRTLRAGATLTIDFIQRNPFRDQLQAAVYSKHGFIPFFDGFRGMLSVLGKDKYYWEWIKSGGRYSDFVATDRRDDIVQKLSDVAPGSKMANMKKWLNPIRTLQAMSELMETATRVQEYKLARSQGKSELEAANAAKDVTLNFSRFGWAGKAFNQLFAFYNANVQDWDKLRREHMGPNRAKVMMKSFMYITMPSIFTWWLGHDDERIQNLPWWRKKGFWNINMGQIARMAGSKTDSDFVFSLPKPFLLAHIYGTSVESALDYAYDRDPNALKKWFVDLAKESPLPWAPFDLEKTYGFNVSTYMPTIGRPIYEATSDYNIHTKRPLESMALQQLPTHMRYHPNTSELMKLVASTANNLTDNGINLSPIKLDNFVRAWLGGLGREGLNIADYFLVKWGLADVPPAPKLTVAEYPGVRAFTVSPYEPSDKIRQFYEATKIVEERIKGLRAADISKITKQQRKESERLAPYLLPMGGNLEGANRMTILRKARTMLSDYSKAMQGVQTDKNMTPQEKTKKLIELKNERDKLAGEYVRLFEPYDLQRVR